MSFEMLFGAIVALLSVALIAVVVVAVVGGVRKAKLNKIKSIVKSFRSEGEKYVDFGKHISVAVDGFSVIDVIANGETYASIREAILLENISGYRRRQLFKLQEELDLAYELSQEQASRAAKIKHEDAVMEQALRKPKFVQAIDTKSIAGVVHVYKPCELVVSDFIKVTIQKKSNGMFTISDVYYAPNGNVRSAKVVTPFTLLTKDGTAKTNEYVHHIEKAENNVFKKEVDDINTILKNMQHYNDLLASDRLVFNDAGDIVQVKVAPVVKTEPKKEAKKEAAEPKLVDPKSEAKEQVEELVELEQVKVK